MNQAVILIHPFFLNVRFLHSSYDYIQPITNHEI
jgi:hypothetical protein